MKPLGSVVLSSLVVGVVIGSQLVLPAAAHASSVLVASPSGTGSACSFPAPCGLKEALSKSTGGSTVVLDPGNYRSPSTAYTDTLADANGRITIEGAPDKALPVIYTDATIGIGLNNGSTLRNVKVVSTAKKPSGPIILQFPLTAVFGRGNATISHVAVFAESKDEVGCAVSGTLVDSLCVADGNGGRAFFDNNLEFSNTDLTLTTTVRGSTLVGRGPKTLGMAVSAFKDTDTDDVNVTNSIMRGTNGSVAVASDEDTASSTVSLSYCDFGAVTKTPNTGTATVTADHTVTTKPVYVNEAHGNFSEAATSPTINAGAVDPAGDVDLSGAPRTLGSAPDIGAYEFRQVPSAPTVDVTKKSKHALHVTVTVNPEGLRTAVEVVAKQGHHKFTTSTKPAIGHVPTTVKLSVHGLKKHKKYHLHAVATNIAGHVSGPHVKAKTTK